MEPRDSYASLVKGVESFNITGDFNPCALLLTGDQAFPVLVSTKGHVLIAATRYGAGRMVVTAHELMLQLPQFLTFIKNSLEWVKPSLTAEVGVHKSLNALSELLRSHDIKVQSDAMLEDTFGAYCVSAYDDTQAHQLVQFVKNGGGLLIGGQAWYWAYDHGYEKALTHLPGNRVTAIAGVYITADMGENGVFPVSQNIPEVPTNPVNRSTFQDSSYALLVKGIKSLDVQGNFDPCELLLTGDQAFPILVSSSKHVLIAASQYSEGRVVVTAHEALLQMSRYLPFIKNSLEWLKPSPTAQIGVHQSLGALSGLLVGSGVKVQSVARLDDSLGVYCIFAYNDSQVDDLVKFIKRGGGLLIGGQASEWSQHLGKEKVLCHFPGNLVTSVSGVYFTANKVQKETFSVRNKMPKVPLITRSGVDVEGDFKILLKDVTDFDLKDMRPSQLLIHGNLVFPVGINDSFQCFVGAAYYGKGRVVVTSHEEMLNRPSMKTFLLNAINWVTDRKGGKVGIGDQLNGLYSMLNQAGIPCELTDLKPGLSVYCCTTYSDREMESIHEFVSEGGSLLIGGQAWSWEDKHPGTHAIAQYPRNKILKKFGIGIMGVIPGESYPAKHASILAYSYHFRKALFQFKEHIRSKHYSSWLKKLGQDCATFLSIPAAHSPPLSSVHKEMLKLLQQRGIPDVSASKPIKAYSDEAILIQMALAVYNNLPGFQSLVPNLSPNFPKYPVAPSQIIQISGTNDGDEAWRSTGLYVPPAKTVTLLFPPAATGAQLQVQIDCRSDDLSDAEEFRRPPVVMRRFNVKSQRMEVSSLWGGLLYIILPKKSSLGTISVTVEGASLAPYFKLGETSLSAWNDTICHYPAPWAELETENIIFTVPSVDVRTMRNPAYVLNIWVEIMKAVAKLAGTPPVFPRPERIVEDVQIVGGGMHAGYPIMSDVTVSVKVTNREMYSEGAWDALRELGHNQQRSGWDFPPHTTDATCYLWSIYVNETVLNIPRERAHPDLDPSVRKKRVKDYIQGGAQLKDFIAWTALEPYLQLQEAFGWDPYMRIFTEYQKITHNTADNKYKMNQWAMRFSTEVKKDLGPFCKAWGWPLDEKLTQELSRSFSRWAEDPMKEHESS